MCMPIRKCQMDFQSEGSCCIPSSSYGIFNSSTSPQALGTAVYFLNYSHANRLGTPIMDVACISLMTDIVSIFSCVHLLSIYLCWWCVWSHILPIFVGLFVCLLLTCEGSLYILDANFFNQMYVLQIFSSGMGFSLNWIRSTFKEQQHFMLMKSSVSMHFLLQLMLLVSAKKSSANSR